MSLMLDVAQLDEAPIGSTHYVDLKGDALMPAGDILTHITGRLSLSRTDRGIRVYGPLQASVESDCSRCLVPFTGWVTLNLDDMYSPFVGPRSRSHYRVERRDEAGFRINDRHHLDLTEAVRQYLVAATPLKPLCQPDCLGICPQCGRDLNAEICNCQFPAAPSWESLRHLLPIQMMEK